MGNHESSRAVGVVATALALAVTLPSGTTWIQRARLVGPEPTEDERFGTAVAVDRATIAVGALNRGTEGQGSVFIYGR